MKEFIEKLIEGLEEWSVEAEIVIPGSDGYDDSVNREVICTKNAIEIVKELAEEYNHGWIDASIEVPSTNRYILLSFSNFSIPQIGRYEADEEGGAFYIGDDTETCVSQDLFVNAWMELPEPYKERDTDAEL